MRKLLLIVETTTGWLELVACNYRADYDLSGHATKSKEKFEVMDNDEKVLPHVFELSMGIDRSLYTILEHSLREDKENDRTVLSLKPYLSPIHVGVLSLVKKDGLAEKTDEIYVSKGMMIYMPEFEAYFHYRNLDVSTVKELARRWNPEVLAKVTKKGAHLALDDILESIDELKVYQQHFFKI